MKKFFILSLIFILILFLVGCSTNSLVAPDGLSLEYNVLSWNKVANASGYVVSVNDQEFSTTQNFLELSLSANVEYVIKVKAIGKGKYSDSDFSEPIVYSAKKQNELTRLATPSILEIDGQGVMYWSLVGNSFGYRIFKNNELYLVIDNKLTTSCALNITDPGHYSIQIQAIGDNQTCSDSAKSNVYKLSIDNEGKPDMPLLSAPSISYDHTTKTLVWNKVRYAVGYFVFLNDVVVARIDATDEAVYSYKLNPNQTTNAYSVTALGDDIRYGMSKKSNEIVFPLVPAEPPSDLRVEVIDGEPTITWDEVTFGTGYRVELNDKTETVLTNKLKLNGYDDGEYSVRVMALGDYSFYSSTLYSAQISVTVVDGKIAMPRLSAPDYPRFINNVLYWNATENAERYKIIVETPYDDSVSTLTFETTDTFIAIDDVFEDTVMIFYVRAFADGYLTSPYSYGCGYIPPAEKRYIDDKGFEVVIKRDQYYFAQTPRDVVYDGTKIMWGAVDYATGYVVEIDGTTYLTDVNSFEYSINGSAIVSVSALTDKDKYYQSPRSLETVLFAPKKLETPSPTIERYTLSWSAIDKAIGYDVYVNGEPIFVSSTVIDLKTFLTVDGKYTISVKAIAEDSPLYVDSLKSVELSFVVDYGEYGTKEKPYVIRNSQDLTLLSEYPSAFFKFDVEVLDLQNAEIEPILCDQSFMGYIDGNGVVIKNFKLKSKNGVGGFFGLLGSSTILNIVFENAVSVDDSPILSSSAYETVIDNVSVSGIVILSEKAESVGGSFDIFEGTAKNVSVNLQIIANDKTLSDCRIGGFSATASGKIENLTVIGKIEVATYGNSLIGAIAGELYSDVNGVLIKDFAIVTGYGNIGLLAGVSQSTINRAEIDGTINAKGGNVGVFGSFGGTFNGNVEIEITVSGEKTTSVGYLAGYLHDASIGGNVVGKITVDAPTVYVGGIAGNAYGKIEVCDVDSLDLTVNANVGFIGGVFGYYNGTLNGIANGTITINVDENITVNVLVDSLIGNRNDKCISSSITLKGNVLSKIFSIPKGSGTSESPYEIVNEEDVLYLSKYPDAYFVLKNDLSLDKIGSLTTEEFKGVFDGCGYKITNAYVDNDVSGLFASMRGATVKNLIVENSRFEGNVVGGLTAVANDCVITEVVVFGTVIAKGEIAGGLIGIANECTVAGCGFNGNIVGVSDKGDQVIGGLIANSSSSIERSYTIFDFEGNNYGISAGFVATSTGEITRSYAVGRTDFSNVEFAGFVYRNEGSVNQCYSATDAKNEFYAFAKIEGDIVDCKFVTPTFVSVYDYGAGITAIDNDVAISDGIFADWDNSKGYSLIADVDGQNADATFYDVTIETNVLVVNVFEYLSFNSRTPFGVGKLTLSTGISVSDGIFTFDDYGTYRITVTYRDGAYTLSFILTETTNPDFDGKGTESDPYVIETAEQLQKAGTYTSETYFVLANDVTIETTVESFSANLNGQNHKLISSVTIFGEIGGNISDLVVSLTGNAYFTLTARDLTLKSVSFEINVDHGVSDEILYVGVFGHITNSDFDSIRVTGTVRGNATYLGGLAGYVEGISSLENITLDLTVSGKSQYAGGVFGYSDCLLNNIDGNVTLENLEGRFVGGVIGQSTMPVSEVELTLTAKENVSSTYFGGVVSSTVADLQNCELTVDVSVKNCEYGGGIVGYGSQVRDCSVTGTIDFESVTDSYLGGIIGDGTSLFGDVNVDLIATVSSSISFVGLAGGRLTSANVTASGSISVVVTGSSETVVKMGCIGSGSVNDSIIEISIAYRSTEDNDVAYIGGAMGEGSVLKSTITISVVENAVQTKAYLGGAVGYGDYVVADNVIGGSIVTDQNCSTGTIAGYCSDSSSIELYTENVITVSSNGAENVGEIGQNGDN